MESQSHQKMASNAGRKTVMTNEVLGKLEYAFSMGCTDNEACLHAGIHPDTLYAYQNKFPKFSERKELLKDNPILKARETIIKNLGNVEVAKWFLERRQAWEFNLQRLQTPRERYTEQEIDKLLSFC